MSISAIIKMMYPCQIYVFASIIVIYRYFQICDVLFSGLIFRSVMSYFQTRDVLFSDP